MARRGNCKPFFRWLRWRPNESKPDVQLVLRDGSLSSRRRMLQALGFSVRGLGFKFVYGGKRDLPLAENITPSQACYKRSCPPHPNPPPADMNTRRETRSYCVQVAGGCKRDVPLAENSLEVKRATSALTPLTPPHPARTLSRETTARRWL